LIDRLIEYVLVVTTIDDERLDAVFAAHADRTRRHIVARLRQGEATSPNSRPRTA
jgi:hypothetical protein